MKKISVLLTAALLLCKVQVAWAQLSNVTFIERSWDATNKQVVETEKTLSSYTELSGQNANDWVGLDDGWYVVRNSGVKYKVLNILGNDVRLVLCDGAEITVTGGVKLENSRSLTIYGQSEDSGKLYSHNTEYDGAAGIGSAENTTCGNLTIHGGSIVAAGKDGAAGIGGGKGANSGNITMYGGSIYCNNRDDSSGGAAIGGGKERGIGGAVNIYGGTLKLWSGDYGAAIGGGDLGNQGGDVNIYGGSVLGYANYYRWGFANLEGGGAGIGGGDEGWGGNVNISGGSVEVHSRGYGAGIGGGQNRGINGTVRISGGTVIAMGYDRGMMDFVDSGETGGAGIGGGQGGSQGGDVIITGGWVKAEGAKRAAGIGGGAYSAGGGVGGNVTITGGTVVAIAGSDCDSSASNGGCAIGSGRVPEREESKGTLSLGRLQMVVGGANEWGNTKPKKDERVSFCHNNLYVTIQDCDHNGGAYIINDGKIHTIFACTYCDASNDEAPHVFHDSKCICGLYALEDNADNTSLIETLNGKEETIAFMGRTLYRNGKWNTLCLPFEIINARRERLLFNPEKVMVFTGSSYAHGTLTLNFSEVTKGTIPAGTPILVRWNESEEGNISDPCFPFVTVSNSLSNAQSSYADFMGTYSPVSIGEEGDNTKLYLGGDNKLYYPNAEMTIGAFRGYFQLNNLTAGELGDPSLANIREFRLNFGDATGIQQLNADSSRSTSSSEWFTLDGRRLSGRPTVKGIYINQGKKTIIK